MLQERAMLANLTIHAWTASKQDKKVTQDVERQHNAKNAGRFNKFLVDESALKPWSQHEGKVRAYHYKMTLPWSDSGDRLLPSTAFMEYTAQMRQFKQEAENLADTFAREYPNLMQAARGKLGTLYDPKDYPPVEKIRSRFGIDLTFLPVPDGNDFRVDVGAEAIEEIKQNINKAVEERQAEAVKEC